MLFIAWAWMWTSAFFPSAGLAALQSAANSAYMHAATLNMSPARQIAQAPLVIAPPLEKKQPLMTLGWESEDEVPIF